MDFLYQILHWNNVWQISYRVCTEIKLSKSITLYDLVGPVIIKKYDPLQSSEVTPFQQNGKIWPTSFFVQFL